MISSIALGLVLVAAAEQADPQQEKSPARQCIPVTGLYLPDTERLPGPNVRLTQFQYQNPEDPCGDRMPRNLLLAIHERLSPIAAASFAQSQSKFGVMVRYTLTPEAAPVLEMRVSDGVEGESERLNDFYREASARADFRSADGVVYVIVQYIVSPAAPADRAAAKPALTSRERWHAAMPDPIKPVWSDSLVMLMQVNIAPLSNALESAVPDPRERIRLLLTWHGSGMGLWSGHPMYEIAAEQMLLRYSTEDLVAAMSSAPLTPVQMEGAARLLAGWNFSEQRPGALKSVPSSLKQALWDHVRITKDTDKFDRARHAFTR